MAKMTRPDLPPGPLDDLMRELHSLHARAGYPSARALATRQSFGYNAVHELFTKATSETPKLPVLLGVVKQLAELAPRTDIEADLDRFDSLWQDAELASNITSEAEFLPKKEVPLELRPPAPLRWVKSSLSGNGACVELAQAGEFVAIRDSKNKDAPPIICTGQEVRAFLNGAKAGKFNYLTDSSGQ